MASWSKKRQALYGGIFIFFVAGALITGYLTVFYRPPSCTDGKQDGSEVGVDCGGSCSTLCSFQLIPPTVQWSRVFQIVPGVYSAVSYVKNNNAEYAAVSADYSLKLYDQNNLLVFQKDGTAYLPADATVPVFDTSLQVGQRVPVRAFVEFGKDIQWQKNLPPPPNILLDRWTIQNEDIAPRLQAELRNSDSNDVANIQVTAVLFDKNNNAVGVSQTVLDSIAKNATEEADFTWPQPLAAAVSRVEVAVRQLEQ